MGFKQLVTSLVKGLDPDVGVTGTDVDGNKRALDVQVQNSASSALPTTDFLFEIAKGNVPGHALGTIAGHNHNASTTQRTVWIETGSYVPPAAATLMTVSSSSANDTAAGTGARSVLIRGLDANYDEIVEVVATNGTAGVSTVQTFLRVNSAIILTAGTGQTNEGVLYVGVGTITAGKPATVYSLIEEAFGTSRVSFYTIPAGKSVSFGPTTTTIDSNKVAIMTFCTIGENGTKRCPAQNYIVGAFVNTTFLSPIIGEKTDITIECELDSGSGIVDTSSSIIIVDNEYTGGA